ncbi:hypothetical protein VP01_3645g4 [Puccinia sorghi]|uniref:Uncharacterized protein n=1 Tax=Puccinia sorghi TaxID=27349 RepID=A0A0L6UVD4_9BASI|nr:hypothetical protein VP01_3645g4 [Puccinia sorghi]
MLLICSSLQSQITYLDDHKPVDSQWESLPTLFWSKTPSRGEGFTRSDRGAGQLIEHILGTAAYSQRPIHIDLGQGPNGPSLGGIVIDPQRGVVTPLTRSAPGRLNGPRRHESFSESPLQTAKEDLLEREKCVKLVVYVNRLSSSPHHSPHLPPQLRQSQRRVMRSLFCLCPWMSLPNPPTSQPSGNKDAEMHDGTSSGNQQGQDVMNSKSISKSFVSPQQLSFHGADRLSHRPFQPFQSGQYQRMMPCKAIGSTAEESGAQDPIESGQPPSNSESGAPQPEDTSNQAPVASELTNAASPAVLSQRVTIMINGAKVDITNTGIDPTFLEALPDDMQEEVLNQQFREQQLVQEELFVLVFSSISTNFLDALPPEIQAEVICSEVVNQQHRCHKDQARKTAMAGSNCTAADPEIDPATFLAGLDPSVREAILLKQDDGFISTLPPNLLAEPAGLSGLDGMPITAVIH